MSNKPRRRAPAAFAAPMVQRTTLVRVMVTDDNQPATIDRTTRQLTEVLRNDAGARRAGKIRLEVYPKLADAEAAVARLAKSAGRDVDAYDGAIARFKRQPSAVLIIGSCEVTARAG